VAHKGIAEPLCVRYISASVSLGEEKVMALISDSNKGGVTPPPQTSRMNNYAVGSGSRPVPSKVKIESSAPENARTLGRDVPGWLR